MTRQGAVAAVATLAVVVVALGGTAVAGAGDVPTLQGNESNATGGNATDGNATAENATAARNVSVNASVLPPGVSETGVTNASALVAAHVAALNATGYEFTFRQNYSVAAGNRTLPPTLAATSAVQNATVAAGFAPFDVHAETQRGTGNRTVASTIDYYGNETVVVARAVQGNRTQYRTFDRDGNATGIRARARPSFTALLTKSRILAGVLRSGTFRVAGTETAGNRTLVTLRATEYTGTLGVAPENVTAYEATVVVDERGLVHRFSFTLASTTRSVPVRLRYGFEVTETGGVNVTRPAWVSEALAAAGREVSVGTRNATFLTVTNTGDRPLPPGTTVTVARPTGEVTLELSRPLPSNATAFVAFADGNATVSVGRPPDVDAAALSGPYRVTVVTPDGRVVGRAAFAFGNATTGNATAGNATTGNESAS